MAVWILLVVGVLGGARAGRAVTLGEALPCNTELETVFTRLKEKEALPHLVVSAEPPAPVGVVLAQHFPEDNEAIGLTDDDAVRARRAAIDDLMAEYPEWTDVQRSRELFNLELAEFIRSGAVHRSLRRALARQKKSAKFLSDLRSSSGSVPLAEVQLIIDETFRDLEALALSPKFAKEVREDPEVLSLYWRGIMRDHYPALRSGLLSHLVDPQGINFSQAPTVREKVSEWVRRDPLKPLLPAAEVAEPKPIRLNQVYREAAVKLRRQQQNRSAQAREREFQKQWDALRRKGPLFGAERPAKIFGLTEQYWDPEFPRPVREQFHEYFHGNPEAVTRAEVEKRLPWITNKELRYVIDSQAPSADPKWVQKLKDRRAELEEYAKISNKAQVLIRQAHHAQYIAKTRVQWAELREQLERLREEELGPAIQRTAPGSVERQQLREIEDLVRSYWAGLF